MQTDNLMIEYYALKDKSVIPNMKEYADAFSGLAAKFGAEERYAMAESCASMYKQYIQLAEYLPDAQKTQMSGYVQFDRLEHKTDEEQPEYDWQRRADMGG